MRRIRLSTLMLLVTIAALVITVVMQQVRAMRREAELRGAQAEVSALHRSFPYPSSEEIWDSFLKRYREEAERGAKSAKPAEGQQKPR